MEREIYGLEQSNHGHLHRWIFTKESLLEQGIDPYDTDCIDIGFPIGGSNSSGTYIRKLNTEEEIKDFLLEEYETEYEDPMLVDIAEGIYTIDMDDEYHGSITTEYVKLFGIPEEELTKENSLLKYAEELINTIKELDTDEDSGIDYENPFYGKSRGMRLSELEDIFEKLGKREMKVIVTYSKFHDMFKGECIPKVFSIKENETSEEALRRIWSDQYNAAIAESEFCEDDPLDEENCWFEEDMAQIAWADGDTKEFYVVEVDEY
jgi:hypothetical protein